MKDINNQEMTILNKHNTLVKGRYNLTSTQNKIYQFILFYAQKNIKINGDVAEIFVPRKEFRRILSKRECERKRLINNLEKIRSKPLEYKRFDSEGNLIWSVYSFFNSYHYYEKTEELEFRIDIDVVRMLIEYIKNGYTKLSIEHLSELNSYYSQRLYELLKLWTNTKNEITYTVDEIKEYMMLDLRKSYSNYGELKRKVIEPSIQDLNTLGIFNITYKENALSSGKISSITFYIETLQPNIENAKNDEFLDCKEDKIKAFENVLNLNQDILSKGVLRRFKIDFIDFDFTDKHVKTALDDAIMLTLDKDNIDIINAESYPFFKSVFVKKIDDYKFREEQEMINNIENDLYW